MPIPVDELKRAARPLKVRILEFLAADADNAYSIEEIYLGVENLEGDVGLWRAFLAMDKHQSRLKPYVTALQELVSEGELAAARVRETQYFSVAT